MAKRKVVVTDEGIGALVREKRKAAGMSQPELGDVLGITEQMIQKYERGASSLTVLKLVAIAEALKCTTLELIPS